MRDRIAEVAKTTLTALARPRERARARRYLRTQPLRLHLGSSSSRKPGWVNVDLLRPGRRLELYWDLRHPLPFPDQTVDAVFSEHLHEHLELAASIALLSECRRVLKPGGVLRVGVPDLGRYLAAYRGEDDIIDLVRPGRPTRAIAIGEVFFLHGHRSAYDLETLRYALGRAGFADARHRAFGDSRIKPCPDSDNRRAETLYVEAVR